MMTMLGYTSLAPVHDMALRLRSMGALDWQDGKARTFNLSKQIQFQAVVLKYRIRFTSGYYSERELRTDEPGQATLFNSQDEAQSFALDEREYYSIEQVELSLSDE
ncbi:hypothetical protein LBWT_11920 [Leptolyngbya boryana IAM M-101]|nr:hypothetical protein LBWT_11920 [Leptolyngbya boryana IAM M-101]BAS61634.1 hypothetical protein LBDG_11920 [Leptolyngbya boryana dg5]